jgi:hypothetical protein
VECPHCSNALACLWEQEAICTGVREVEASTWTETLSNRFRHEPTVGLPCGDHRQPTTLAIDNRSLQEDSVFRLGPPLRRRLFVPLQWMRKPRYKYLILMGCLCRTSTLRERPMTQCSRLRLDRCRNRGPQTWVTNLVYWDTKPPFTVPPVKQMQHMVTTQRVLLTFRRVPQLTFSSAVICLRILGIDPVF